MTDETTSPERQREQIGYTVKARGDTLVGIAEDLDVSGAVSAWNRDLAPWLTDCDKVAQWDGLIVAKLDRLTRSLLDFQRLLEWCADHGKTIVSVSEGFDLSSPTGRMFANILIMFAEFERARMSERRAEAAAKLRGQGYWQGERPMYGYKTVKVGDRHHMVPDAEQAKVVNWMADQVIAGKSQNWIAGELDRRKVPTMRNGTWTRTQIGRILRSPTINGQIVVWEKTANGGRLAQRVILGVDGMPLRREPVLGDDKWAQVNKALDATRVQWSNRYDAAPLLNVVFCASCGKSLYGKHTVSRGKQYDYYGCSASCGARNVPMDVLHTALDDAVLDAYGWAEHTELVTHAGDDHSRELAAVGRQIADLTEERYVRRIMRPDFDALMAQLQAEHARLVALPSDPEWTEERPTGVLTGDLWPTLDLPEKRRYFLGRGWKAHCARRSDGFVSVTIEGGGLTGDSEALQRL